jgi:drug/metabolite transporter (DMT)-like permease
MGYRPSVLIGLVCAFGAAVCYGFASVLQALAARRTAMAEGLDPRLMLRLVKSWRYVLGLGLDLGGFLLTLVAVQTLPLFVVQSVVASFLAITAVLGAVMLNMRLSRTDLVGLAVVIVGLVCVGLSAAEDSSVEVSSSETWGVLIATVLLAVLAVPLGRLSGARGAAALGAVAGLAFGATSVAARMLPEPLSFSDVLGSVGKLLADPATYALAVAGGVALLAYSTALQRGSVTAATAPLVVGETIAPALVGILLLGDQPREGWGWVAVLGFVLAVGGALILSGHGEVREAEPDARASVA